ncbi:hypothetical protein Btru_051967 [Bulinus truncatus]|nr:hypothetical protein Btru_051967 [Bulinus truncatus]
MSTSNFYVGLRILHTTTHVNDTNQRNQIARVASRMTPNGTGRIHSASQPIFIVQRPVIEYKQLLKCDRPTKIEFVGDL